MKLISTASGRQSLDAAATYIFDEFGAMPLIDFYKNLDEIEEDVLNHIEAL